jgi:hypothetical protein
MNAPGKSSAIVQVTDNGRPLYFLSGDSTGWSLAMP